MPVAPTLTWVSASSDSTPEFDIDLADPQVADIVTLQLATDTGFTTGLQTYTDPLDSSEVSALAVSLGIAAQTNGTFYARAKHSRGAADSDWSNTETVTINDTTAPTLSSPNGAATGQTTATLSVTTDEASGTLYAVLTTSSTAPSAAQVKAGQTNTGSAATFAGSQSISSTGAKTISVTGLTAATTYYAYFMHEDIGGNQSTVAAASSFATDGAALTLDFTSATYTGATPTCSRAASGYAETLAGALTAFGNNTLRRTDKGLLVEPASTNRALQSRDLTAAPWSNAVNAPTLTANYGTAPDGTTTSTHVQCSAFGGREQNIFGAGVGDSVSNLVSAWVRGTGTFQLKLTQAGVADHYSGTLTATSSWALRSYSAAFGAGGSGIFSGVIGDAGADLEVWGFDVKVNESTASSPIDTTTTSATRAADQVSFTIPSGITTLTYTFDDNSTQVVSVAAGAYTIPTSLNGRYIKRVVGS